MKILWLCNIVLPKVAKKINDGYSFFGGWLVGLSDSLAQADGYELCVCSPLCSSDKVIDGETDGLKYYCFPQGKHNNSGDLPALEQYFESILKKEKPDIVHIFGTEYIHTLAMVNTCKKLDIIDKTIIQIQGILYYYLEHYCAGLPENIDFYNKTLHDIKRKESEKKRKEDFEKRSVYELEAFKQVKHIIGRTDFDRAFAYNTNPNAKYHFCNESLRDSFYNNSWDIEKCQRHSIFVSQCSYPIKGFHYLLKAMPEILKKYPDTHIYTTGTNLKSDKIIEQQTFTSYGMYLHKLIIKYGLREHITFLGELDEQKMCESFLKANVFVSPSTIENSPNSVGEAMLLGVPVVSSDVGGVKNMLTHGEEGYLYQYDADYMLTYYVCKMFDDEENAKRMSANAKKHAQNTHNRENNLQTLLKIYNDIAEM